MSNKIAIKLDERSSESFARSFQIISGHQDAITRLQAELDRFPERLAQALRDNEFLDQALAIELHGICLQLMEHCSSTSNLDELTYVLAAIDYFVTEVDGSPDFTSLDGFEDDEEVIRAVVEQFNIQVDEKFMNRRKGA